MTRWATLSFLTVAMACIGVLGTIYGIILMTDNLGAVLNDGESWMTVFTRQGAVTILATGGVFLVGAVVTHTASEVLDYIESRNRA